jgi:hypothetical protein
VTARLKQALALVDLRLLDHFVIGDGPPVSLAARGWVSRGNAACTASVPCPAHYTARNPVNPSPRPRRGRHRFPPRRRLAPSRLATLEFVIERPKTRARRLLQQRRDAAGETCR